MNRNKILIPIVVFTAIIIILIIVLNPRHRYNKLIVNEQKWSTIQESRAENRKLVLEEIKFNDNKLIIDEKNDTVYYSIVIDSKNKYNPEVRYKSNNKNVKLAILSDEITDEKVKSNYQFKLIIYDEKEYHIYNLKCTDLPILNISYNQNEDISHKNIPMEMYLFDNLSNIPNKITVSSGKIKVNEDSLIFSLHMLTPGKNKRDNRKSILGMNPNSEYVLKVTTSQYQSDKNHRVELFLNNEYKGTYSIEPFNGRAEQPNFSL